ncbi:MAG: hypothetical protein AAFU03_08600 [Bacteroidota bacterium]
MPTEPISPDWTSLVQSIQDGEAVLVLGPDAIPYYHGETVSSFSALTREAIMQEVGKEILHFYERDNLFQFRDSRSKRKARKCIREVARTPEWQPDDELLRQIVSIPFPVVLNLNPDRRVFDAFVKYWRAPQFDYFTTKDKPELFSVEYPTGQKPLLYNLAGSVEDKMDSTVLDYNDLFDLLKNLLSDHGVPENLTNKLKEADHFVLLGVELERWYLQLFLHYINQLDSPFDNYNHNYPIFCRISEDSRQFIIKQFNITHHSLSREDFGRIYESCAAKRGLLRKLRDPLSPQAEKIRGMVIAGQLDQAFSELTTLLDEDANLIELPLLQARYHNYLENQRAGIMAEADLKLEINQIRYALLSFAAQIAANG